MVDGTLKLRVLGTMVFEEFMDSVISIYTVNSGLRGEPNVTSQQVGHVLCVFETVALTTTMSLLPVCVILALALVLPAHAGDPVCEVVGSMERRPSGTGIRQVYQPKATKVVINPGHHGHTADLRVYSDHQWPPVRFQTGGTHAAQCEDHPAYVHRRDCAQVQP